MSKPPGKQTCNAKQLAWIQYVLDGNSDWKAYHLAYKCTEQSAKDNAYKLRADNGVVTELNKQREESFAGKSMGRLEKEAILAEIARSNTATESDKIRATNEHNRMTGDHEPTKVEVNAVGSLMEMLRNGEEAN